MAESKKAYVPRLKERYRKEIVGNLKKEFNFSSVMQVPAVEKIVVSMGVGEAITNKNLLNSALDELGLITGQRGIKTKAKKSIAGFKIRKGQDIGAKVTLRGKLMYEFLDRLINIAIPRVKDFRGINPNAFDGRGNFSMGVNEQIIFAEIDYDKIEKIRGLNIAITTTGNSDEEGRALLREFGMPFKK